MNRETASLIETAARLALTASIALGRGIQAVDGFCEDARTGGLTHTSWAAKEEGVSQLSSANCVFEGGGNVTLAHNRFEGLRAVFACRNNEVIIHLLFFSVRYNLTKVVRKFEKKKIDETISSKERWGLCKNGVFEQYFNAYKDEDYAACEFGFGLVANTESTTYSHAHK